MGPHLRANMASRRFHQTKARQIRDIEAAEIPQLLSLKSARRKFLLTEHQLARMKREADAALEAMKSPSTRKREAAEDRERMQLRLAGRKLREMQQAAQRRKQEERDAA